MPETLDEIKKYVGPFSGPQMDQIFYEILNYTSERFAKGTAGGVPVAAGTPGYNDNSLFYKNQAAAQVSLAQAAAAAAANSAQRAESAVPAGTDAAVLWTRDQSTELTADDKAVARKNIMAGGSNPNLIMNPWFTVNQRAETSGNFANNAYRMDRWRTTFGTNSAGTWTLSTNGLTLNGTNSGLSYFEQIIDNYTDLIGEQLTASVLYEDGTIECGTVTFNGQYQQIVSNNLVSLLFQANGAFRFAIYPNATATIKAVKLELGSISTLANDAPPNYAEELAKCQRYFIRLTANNVYGTFGIGVVNNSQGTAGWLVVPLPTTMRNVPTATFSGTIRALGFSGGALVTGTITNIVSGTGSTINCARLDITGSNLGAIGSPFILGANNDATAYIDLSADL